jgi:GAF domain-containing protein
MASTSSSPAATSPSTRERTLARLIEHVRTLIPVSAVAFVAVDQERGAIERSAAWFADDALRDVLGSPGTHPLDGRGRQLVEAALERDRPFLLPRLDAWEAAPDLLAAAVDALGPDRAGAMWRTCCRASVIACPLRTDIGSVLGVLVVASLDPERPLRRGDLRTVEAVADLSATALERVRMLEDESRRARDERRLKHAGESISASLDLDEVYGRIMEHATTALGATKVLLTRLNTVAGELRVVASAGVSARVARRRLSLESGSFGGAARRRHSLVLRRHEADGVDRELMDAEGLGSLMHAPIELGPRLYGVVTVGHEDADRFGDADLELLTRLARSSAAAVANAIDFQRERRIARALTLGFVPEELPGVPGYETGLLYAPALGEPAGGDLYGMWETPSGDIALLVGDVAGKGVENAALSAMTRFFIEARSWNASSPARVLDETNSMLLDRLPSDVFVTAFFGFLSHGSLRWASAGHLPALHLSAGGVRGLEGAALPLGVDLRPGYRDRELELAPGDVVFAYTDGLVEARRGEEAYGAERLASLVADRARTLAPPELPQAVRDEIAGWAGGLSDDVVALALRRAARSA